MCHPETCPLANRCTPRIPDGADPRIYTICVCDKDVGRLVDLIETGVDQVTASLMVWAPRRLSGEGAA